MSCSLLYFPFINVFKSGDCSNSSIWCCIEPSQWLRITSYLPYAGLHAIELMKLPTHDAEPAVFSLAAPAAGR